ncbi:MAG: glycosyltransferase family 2 protein [Paracoccaceae bacterium]|nr:glycosyltransferase family 2 protein [Paracoccaceae bacterium]
MSTDVVSPAVTIGLPVYNGENYLEVALSSILAQTFTDFELVISDNCSTDRTEEICRKHAAADERIRYIRQPKNVGGSHNYNIVLSEARGHYFKWAAHDDLIEPDFLERCVAVLEEDPGCILAYPRTIIIDAEGDAISGYIDYLAIDTEDAARRLRRYLIPPGGEPNPVFGVFRTEVLQNRVEMGHYVSSDRVFLSQVAMMGRSRLVPAPLFMRRIHPGVSVSVNKNHLDLTQWFTGRKARGLRFRNLRLVRELFGAVRNAELTPEERKGCYRVLLKWMWLTKTSILKELAIPLYQNGQPTALGRFVKSLVRRKSGPSARRGLSRSGPTH